MLAILSDLGWGTYMTDDGENHNAYTNLQQAVNAAAANDTVWVENGYVWNEGGIKGTTWGALSRLVIPRKMTVRSRSGKWEDGAVIEGQWECDVSGGTATVGPNARAGVVCNGATVMGFVIRRCSTQSGITDGNAFINGTAVNCFFAECVAGYNNLRSSTIRNCVISNFWGGTYGGICRECNMYDTLIVDYGLDKSSAMSDSACQFTGTYTVSNCVFRNCFGNPWLVGATKSTTGSLLDCTFEGNRGAAVVGVSYNADQRLTLKRCTFRGNTCASISTPYRSDRVNNTILAYDCFLTNNLSSPVVTPGSFYNCLIANNSGVGPTLATNGDPGYSLKLFNCTVYGNTQTGNFGTLGANVKAVNTIVRNNTLKSGYTDSFAAATNCCIEATASVAEGKNNTTEEPRLVNPAGGIYSPSELSPCNGTGSLTAYELPATDLAGRSRTTDGEVSMGAYEYDPTKHYFAVSQKMPTYLYPPATVTFNADVSGFGFTPVFYWDLDGDGVADEVTKVPTLTHAFDVGHWPVALSVSNLTLKTGSTLAYEPFSVTPRPVRYVKAGNEEGAAEPYDTEANAAADIQTAINYCADGDEVVILPGTYPITQSVVVDKDLIVHGSTGNPVDVVIQGNKGTIRCLNIHGGAATIVHSVTLANGGIESQKEGAGVLIGNDVQFGASPGSGILSNCVVRGCYGSNKTVGSTGVAAFGPNAFVTHCVISNCSSYSCYNNGGRLCALGLYVNAGARAENCLVAKNFTDTKFPYGIDRNTNLFDETGALTYLHYQGYFHAPVVVGDQSSIRFCTIVDNRASFCGGVNVIGRGRFERCVIAGNDVIAKELREGDAHYKVWSMFKSNNSIMGNIDYDFRNGKTEFDAFVTAEQSRADEYSAAQTSNAVDVAGVTLGEGTIVAPTEKLVRNLARGRYDLPASSPAIDVVPADAVSAMATKDLIGNRRLFCGAYDLGAFERQQRGTMILVR